MKILSLKTMATEQVEDINYYQIQLNGDVVWRNEECKLHRLDGPAIIRKGYHSWYKNGMKHREDGPAYVSHTGYKTFYLNDKMLSFEKFKDFYLNKNGVPYVDICLISLFE